MPRVTVQAVREHLERHGGRLGRSPAINQFFAEAARLLMDRDLERLQVLDAASDPELEGDESAAAWEDVPKVRKSQQ